MLLSLSPSPPPALQLPLPPLLLPLLLLLLLLRLLWRLQLLLPLTTAATAATTTTTAPTTTAATTITGRRTVRLFSHADGKKLYKTCFKVCRSLPYNVQSSSSIIYNREGRWGTTDDIATSFLLFSPFSTALWDLAISWPVHSLMLSSHLFLCLPCLLQPFTVPCKMVLA